MEFWHLPINLSAQIAPDYISEYLNFQNFLEPWTLFMGTNAPILYLASICSTKAYKQKMPKNAPVKEWRLANNVREKY